MAFDIIQTLLILLRQGAATTRLQVDSFVAALCS
jgi:hypothetical protein